MRWTRRLWHHGDERVRTLFAILPVTVYRGKHSETRWLCWVTLRQRFFVSLLAGRHCWWEAVEFLDS